MRQPGIVVVGHAGSVAEQARRGRWVWWTSYASVMAVGLALVLVSQRNVTHGFSVALALFLVTACSWVVAPLVGLHLTVFFALVGDALSIPWFPFNKNLSSHESVLFVADSLTTSPLELSLIIGLASWCLRRVADPTMRAVTGPLFVPLAVFSAFVAFGFLNGVGRGGDLRIALFEVRGLVYLPIVYFLASNLCRTAAAFRRLMWTAAFAVLAHALLSLRYYASLEPVVRSGLERLGEHGSTVPMNAMFMFALASWSFIGSRARARWGLLLMSVPVGWAYVISQRRAAFVALAVGVVLLAITLAWRQRSTFRRFAPTCVAGTAAYTAAFWNVTDGLGFGAQALKVVLAPGAQSDADRQSDVYRTIENFDLNFTIRQSPVTGLGFGQPFHRPVPLPDIGALDLLRYMPHNSILWVWIKVGFFGFVAVLYVIARALVLGAGRLRRLVDGRDVAVVMTATATVAMYTVYAFVDIAWDARNTVLLGAALAICANLPVSDPDELRRDPGDRMLVEVP